MIFSISSSSDFAFAILGDDSVTTSEFDCHGLLGHCGELIFCELDRCSFCRATRKHKRECTSWPHREYCCLSTSLIYFVNRMIMFCCHGQKFVFMACVNFSFFCTV
jgi:hypothetical protein